MEQSPEWVYTQKVKDHFMHPQNILFDEARYAADGRGLVGDIKCGDQMLLWIRVAEGRITDCKWRTYGCASAIASTSMLSEMVKGMPLDQAFAITPRDIVRELGGLPDHKIHCSVLGDKALRAAINDYYRTHGMEDKVREEKSRMVCACLQITDSEIEHAVLEGARTFIELQDRTKIATACGKCRDDAEAVLVQYVQRHFPSCAQPGH